ncbi:SDR family oxidoreductase [Ponticoccus sp. SC2-23]|uniref:SDR family NAD(P)-dependent oxidoreductase n=1 Tax=Alexandriicola marinus TaxID=2081710 RepID=UPI000FD73201|nr:SDR family oxidoreductase [Alexandriicola marinus]MBM1222148.1 SDR family oxidoreductase [Ponticoccus sp. SC6-9]MBM1226835.1 SDR family oxidoreductase [Ponticoccus sp. SC6-15]MBM1231095.1 SDR family oxidoreductase [Ponticoccus sp. SC6-38]MBM1235653.1 SDR family oxidoreductase [Ponticoccus sp. SC6-45]MBM1240117.1 SDR family oxidoreductase [Ponticoccus sp. SC6-49]MBM1244471.1 SDR family oxidoreductase [Ponticoccus sp. SC2-64]MBM1249127.1 SDR family oxidoreductase [Ponticoccus sp. SC6-42]MB
MSKAARFGDLEGASVFITGGASGIGGALTEGFAAQGARVAAADLLDGSDLGARIRAEHGTEPMFVQCDVTDTPALTAAMEQAAGAHGPISILVNCAANDMRMEADTVTPETWEAMIAVNLTHYFFAAQTAARMMRAQGGGSIINYSSITYALGSERMSPYVTSNAGIVGMTRALAREWGRDGIRVNAIAPGMVLTQKQLDMWVTEESITRFMEKQCLKQRIGPADLVGPTLFLASAASAMITGQVVAVDAGVISTG